MMEKDWDYLDCEEMTNPFNKELRAMMYSFGDVEEPLQASVNTLYNILREEMNVLLVEAERIAKYRKGKIISHEDILFLMRKNKGKLKRMIQYFEVLDESSKYGASTSQEIGNLARTRRTKAEKIRDFLAYIEDLGDITSVLTDETVVDRVYRNMLERRNYMTSWMDLQEYNRFINNVLKTSFCAKEKLDGFERWLLEDKVVTLKLSSLVFEMARFLARETVLKIVDLVLIKRAKKNRKQKSPKDKQKERTIFDFCKLPNNANTDDFVRHSLKAGKKRRGINKKTDHLYCASSNPRISDDWKGKSDANPCDITNLHANDGNEEMDCSNVETYNEYLDLEVDKDFEFECEKISDNDEGPSKTDGSVYHSKRTASKTEDSLRKYYQVPYEMRITPPVQSPITQEEIISAVANYHQHSYSSTFHTMHIKPKAKLLCIEEYPTFESNLSSWEIKSFMNHAL